MAVERYTDRMGRVRVRIDDATLMRLAACAEIARGKNIWRHLTDASGVEMFRLTAEQRQMYADACGKTRAEFALHAASPPRARAMRRRIEVDLAAGYASLLPGLEM